jgi:hypothetical protein
VTGSGDVTVGTDGWSTITMPKRSSAKVILDANAVIAQHGDVRFEQQYCDPGESGSEPAVERCQIYSNPPLPEGTPPGPYQELEFTSPRQPITRSHPARMHIRWTLTKTSAATAIAKPRNSTPSTTQSTR